MPCHAIGTRPLHMIYVSSCCHSHCPTQNGPSSGLRLGWPARVAGGETLLGPEGSPAPGLDFLDWCVEVGALRNGGASFPRMGQYAGGLATSQIAGEDQNQIANDHL